jgi:4-diphosphocytidyl-2-C-methyl-D-erythritol kinase
MTEFPGAAGPAPGSGRSAPWWPAPAKLNLFLHVTGRRADGYHELQTAFQLIDLADDLSFEITDDGRIERADDGGAETGELAAVVSADDLAVRAAKSLQAATGCRAGARIRIRKRIPLGGGLGGGSSDAATTLRVLDALWQTGVARADLARLALPLGADVPVFIAGESCWAEGVGERLTPRPVEPAWFVVVHPGVSVGTREVFQAAELTRNSPLITIPPLLRAGGRNDCEHVVRARFPPVAAALDWLGQFAPAYLTGTGACIFASLRTEPEARQIAAQVPAGWRAWVARGLQESPLEARLAALHGAGTQDDG